MYYGVIDYDIFWNWLRHINCGYALSFDGISGDLNKTYDVPKDVYNRHEYLLNGNSSFKKVVGKTNYSTVYESLYVK